MKITREQKRLSANDYRRLTKTFFTPVFPKLPENIPPKQKIILACAFVCLFGIAGFAFFQKFHIIVLPKPYNISDKSAVDLLSQDRLLSVELINPKRSSKILKDIIYIDIPFQEKSGFSLNLKEKTDMSNSSLLLVAKNPFQDLELDVILRDNRFLSNALNPIKVNLPLFAEKTTYIQIPIKLHNSSLPNVNLFRINQVRFSFSQKKEESLHLLVKNVYLKSGDE